MPTIIGNYKMIKIEVYRHQFRLGQSENRQRLVQSALLLIAASRIITYNS